MADTVISDAAKFPQDEGYPNISDGSETWNSAGHLSLLALATANGPFIYDGLTFTGHDATNDQVDVTAGVAVLDLSEDGSIDVQSTTGGSSAPSYDTTLSKPGAVVVECPTTTSNLDVVDTQTNPIWIAYATDDSVTDVSAGDVYFRHENGGSVSAPPHPSLKIGEANPDDSSADFRAGFDNPPDNNGYREDPNSPFTQSIDSGNFTMNLSGRYDVVRVEGVGWSDRAQNSGFDIRINGDSTSNYTVVEDGSNVNTGKSLWGPYSRVRTSSEDVDGNVAHSFEFVLVGDWPSGATEGPGIEVISQPMQDDGGANYTWEAGYHSGGLSPPLTSITFVEDNDTGFEVTIKGKKTDTRPNI